MITPETIKSLSLIKEINVPKCKEEMFMDKINIIDGITGQGNNVVTKVRDTDKLSAKLPLTTFDKARGYGEKNPYNCDKAPSGECKSYPGCGCQFTL